MVTSSKPSPPPQPFVLAAHFRGGTIIAPIPQGYVAPDEMANTCTAISIHPLLPASDLRRSASRYSHSEAQLVELITHAALNEKLGSGTTTGTATSAVHAGAKRRRLDISAHDTTTSQCCSPLEVISENSQKDPEWAAFHYRQAWFLQVIMTSGWG